MEEGLIFACVLDGAGGGHELDWDGVRSWKPADGLLWIHLDYQGPAAQKWLRDESNIDPVMRQALTTHDPRPRTVREEEALLLIVRGVNLNEGAEPDDMISVRIWAEANRIVTLRHRRVNATKAMRRAILDGTGPATTGDFVLRLYQEILTRIERTVSSIDDGVDDLEEQVVTDQSLALRQRLGYLRRQAIAIRRHIGPQRDTLGRLENARVPWLDDDHRIGLRECADRQMRMIEELEAARERAAVTNEELANRMSETLNNRLYVLALVAAIFLPLGLLTGLWGINVGGVPLQDNPYGFAIACGALVLLSGLQLWLFRKLKWL